ncbi:2-polyprenyl-6-methoxyphenol hydroxylase-like FAD-dependent oxidoreductase [Streptomyces sp. B3I7]|uniref:FAD-dependent monooxygenase n=1 Tax=Streptomyces sp. B3I7 TaxID=3042269 RepID=UPI002783DDD2|nr:FAD-dependent monooxygenase [Streptomyces sp. B3I7]MDQ0812218.1 2-polyprenyl-6-methoxyphenol hydroxylase-like FAD-dependent oxidoreductase [Streptomyces sp. B3I7]
MTTHTSAKRSVLISGASVSGPALAYWLHRSGRFEVTVVEKAPALRAGGYPIDIRGTAVEVVRRAGLLPRLREAHLDARRATFLDAGGEVIVSVKASALAGGVEGHDLEVRREDLSALLYESVRDDVEFLFGDSLVAFEDSGQSGQGVDVTFRSGLRRTFDLVVGADGMHSATRAALFGPEERYHRYLGYCFALFTMDNTLGLDRELLMWNTPGRAAALYATGNPDEVHAFLTFHRPEPPHDALRDPEAGPDLVASVFADAGWEVPAMVGALREAADPFLDTAGQIRLPHWSRGRVALVGDAAYAPSFLTGQGTSLALVGAYMLAHSLLAHPDHTAAFAAYGRDLREFVALNQGLVDDGGARLFPLTTEALEKRNTMLRGLVALPAPTPRPAHTALVLPRPAR